MLKEIRNPNKSDFPDKNFFVTMTDEYFSGAVPEKYGEINKFVVGVNTIKQAKHIKKAASEREEMKYVSIRKSKPYYNNSDLVVSYRDWSEVGGSWKEGYEE